MKLRIVPLLLYVLILASCKRSEEVHVQENIVSSSIQTEKLSKDIYELEKYARSFQPSKIDFSDNDELNKFDLQYIYCKELNDQDSLRNEIANVLLLKLYLFHISNFHQGYDLLSMRKGEAKFVIDYFVMKHNLNKDLEMLNSGHPYTLLKTNEKQSKEINNLCKKIEIEEGKILKQQS